jgi:transcriptional regulator with XRE-family HTH domain
MMSIDKATVLRIKKLAVLIRDARTSAGRDQAACAEAMGISHEEFAAVEAGELAPTLPQLEALAYYLNMPLSHFWGNQVVQSREQPSQKAEKREKLQALRQRIIGVKIRQKRQEDGLELSDVAERTGLAEAQLVTYESGEQPIPLTELEKIAIALGATIQEFFDGHGPVGAWMREHSSLERLLEMPEELQEFVIKPFNRPYLEIAKTLSEMDVKRLRAVAEGLLDITL